MSGDERGDDARAADPAEIVAGATSQARALPRRAASRWPTAPGGKASQSLIEGLLLPALRERRAGGSWATRATLAVDGAALALTTDSFVVTPLRFPGGSIGELAVNGTVNDLAVSGARPLALTLSLVLEEGLATRASCAPRSRRSRGPRRRPGCR